jgi:hypothetical protein
MFSNGFEISVIAVGSDTNVFRPANVSFLKAGN